MTDLDPQLNRIAPRGRKALRELCASAVQLLLWKRLLSPGTASALAFELVCGMCVKP